MAAISSNRVKAVVHQKSGVRRSRGNPDFDFQLPNPTLCCAEGIAAFHNTRPLMRANKWIREKNGLVMPAAFLKCDANPLIRREHDSIDRRQRALSVAETLVHQHLCNQFCCGVVQTSLAARVSCEPVLFAG